MFFHALLAGSRGCCLNTRPFSKNHVQTAHESHVLNMDFMGLQTAPPNKFPCKNSYFNIYAGQQYILLRILTINWKKNSRLTG